MSLFVGNISKNVRKSDLTEEFDRFGKCDINLKVLLLLEGKHSPLAGPFKGMLMSFIATTPPSPTTLQ
jgi:hypothetical protein